MIIDTLLAKLFGTPHERFIRRLTPLVTEIGEYENKLRILDDDALAARTVAIRERLTGGASLDDVLAESFALVREAGDRRLGILNVLDSRHGFNFAVLGGTHQKAVQEALERLEAGEDPVGLRFSADFYEAVRALHPDSVPPFRMRIFDVQLYGGIILHRGRIAEMKTGEGKTLVATLAVYLNALEGRGVHVVTVNDYLARRDSQWMGLLYRFLGLSVGLIVHGLTEEQRRSSYACDITYGTNNEFGFDYLRDNMARHRDECVQRELNFAIVDEVDSILIDEARTPLIISGPADESTDKYQRTDAVIPFLRRDVHYTVEEKHKNVMLTEQGVEECERRLGLDNLYGDLNTEWVHHIQQALKAHVIFQRDVDYVVQNGQVIIVDEFTGRIMQGRRWSEGLHQAVEAKERVQIARENQTLATITFQNYFRMYRKLSGMTGTADTEAFEFNSIYRLGVVAVPTHRPMVRSDYNDWVFLSQKDKDKALVEDIRSRYELGQPILVGTVSIEKSEHLSAILRREGVAHEVLNAKQHEREANIVLDAGSLGQVTIATNMAGRGTDIVLRSFTWDALLEHWKSRKFAPRQLPQEPQAQDAALIDHWAERDLDEKERAQLANLDLAGRLAKINEMRAAADLARIPAPWEMRARGGGNVRELGGLHIVGTERHESRRIDNQLRGRSGRQGDPGSSRFFLSLDDDLMRIFGGENIRGMMMRVGAKEGEVISHPILNRSIAGSQKRVEGQNFEIRKHLLEYDDVMNAQRTVIYRLRRRVLEGEDVRDEIRARIEEAVEIKVQDLLSEKRAPEVEAWTPAEAEIRRAFGVTYELGTAYLADTSRRDIIAQIAEKALQTHDAIEEAMGADRIRELERQMLLAVIDHLWKQHLYEMDHLKDAIRFRGYAQRDPLSEYKQEGFRSFSGMMERLANEVAERILHLEVGHIPAIPQRPSRMRVTLIEGRGPVGGLGHPEEAPPPSQVAQPPARAVTAPALPGTRPVVAPALPGTRPVGPAPLLTPRAQAPEFARVGRNDPCPCGSGKKFKNCHGAAD